MQAIITKYLPATNFKPSRMKATCARGSVTVSYDHDFNNDGNHFAAASELCSRFVIKDKSKYVASGANPWSGPRIMGTLPNGDYCHVFLPRK